MKVFSFLYKVQEMIISQVSYLLTNLHFYSTAAQVAQAFLPLLRKATARLTLGCPHLPAFEKDFNRIDCAKSAELDSPAKFTSTMLRVAPRLLCQRGCSSATCTFVDASKQTISAPSISFYRPFSKCHNSREAIVQPPHPPSTVGASEATPSPRRSLLSRRYIRISIWATVFLIAGLTTGKITSAILIPPPLPLPDTDEEAALLSLLRKDLSNLPLVQELRAKRDEWLEYEAYMSDPLDEKAAHLVAGAMRGYKGLGVQRVFWNKRGNQNLYERRLICMVFFGGALAGEEPNR